MARKRIPELDMGIKWKTFYDLLCQKPFKDEMEKGTVAALICLSDLSLTHETAVRWKALCDVLRKEPFRVETPRRGLIAALILIAVSKKK
ncbi:MAG: hypothetical protein U9O98_03775 [Asgard group archaeon]|nr:hypothetical protein [Asgard group archaeon]